MPKYYIKKENFDIVKTEEIQRYVDSAKHLRMKVLISLAFLTGARISELLRLRKRDILIDKAKSEFRIKLVSLKTYSSKRYKTAKLTGEVLIPPTRELVFDSNNDPFIKEFIIPLVERQKTEKSKLFLRSKRWYQYKLLELNRIVHKDDESKYITFHYLRHSAITHIARDLGANVADIMSWTGHRGSSFEVYLIPSPVEKFKGKMGKR